MSSPPRPTARWPAVVVACAFAITMMGTTLPTPLYPAYETQFGVANLQTTVIYAVYAGGVLTTLILLGSASDVLGRRPLLLAGLAVSALSSAVFLTDAGVVMLYAGRVLSGFSAGIFTGTATVALVELVGPDRRKAASLVAGVVNMLGLGCGPLLAGMLAAWVRWPLRLPYAVHLALALSALAALRFIPETVTHRGGKLRPQRPRVAAGARAAFVPAAVVAFAAFSVFGLLTAIEPIMLSDLLHRTSPALAGTLVFAMFAASAAGQLASAPVPWPVALPTGCVVLVVGLVAVLLALASTSFVLLVVGTVLVGAGQGVAFSAGLAMVTAASPPDRRAETVSAYFVVAYVGISIPVILVGVAATVWDLRAAGIGFTAAVAVITLGALAAVLRLGAHPAERTT